MIYWSLALGMATVLGVTLWFSPRRTAALVWLLVVDVGWAILAAVSGDHLGPGLFLAALSMVAVLVRALLRRFADRRLPREIALERRAARARRLLGRRFGDRG